MPDTPPRLNIAADNPPDLWQNAPRDLPLDLPATPSQPQAA